MKFRNKDNKINKHIDKQAKQTTIDIYEYTNKYRQSTRKESR
jgi:hypothetical protein